MYQHKDTPEPSFWETHNLCPTCRGTGVEPGHQFDKKRNNPRIGRSNFQDPPCPTCGGTGEYEPQA